MQGTWYVSVYVSVVKVGVWLVRSNDLTEETASDVALARGGGTPVVVCRCKRGG